MWALKLSSATLEPFDSPESIPGGYAILSHVWDRGKEQSFQEIQEICKRCAETGESPRDHVGDKIRQFCIIAERDGHKWGWADTCCIDKTSSAELSEAINSMYRYYTLADTCYAYLRDVPATDVVNREESSFRKSRWHKRGWTLQELIAPALLIFLSRDWQTLGTKGELAGVLEEVTGVAATVLRSEEDLTDFSIAQRMSWAANRKTTRMEDEAYCLMGLFGINMPTLYGEGQLAFRRLQEEIMRQSIDTTLFAWGATEHFFQANPKRKQYDYHSYLFATSPSDFDSCKNVSFNMPHSPSIMALQAIDAQSAQSLAQSAGLPLGGLPTFSITPYGVHARIPVFEVPNSKGELIAVLFWRIGGPNERLSLGLLLDAEDPLRPVYYCGDSSARHALLRGDTLDNLSFDGKTVKPTWKELYIAHSPPPDVKSIPRLPFNSSPSSPFHFPRQEMELLGERSFKFVDVSRADYSWDGHPPVHFVYKYGNSRFMVLQLGRCASPPTSSAEQSRLPDRRSGAHWATVNFYSNRLQSSELPKHSCAEDHICDWPGSTKTFTHDKLFIRRRPIALSLVFVPWGRNPNTTLVMHFVIEKQKKRQRVSQPTRTLVSDG